MSLSAPEAPSSSTSPSIRAAVEGEVHSAGSANALEDVVFGTLDGVVTSLALAVSVAGVLQLTSIQSGLTVIAAAVAGSLSMFVGALLSARARANLVRSERAREEREVREMPEEEREEVRAIYRARGFTEEETEILVRRVTADPKRWVDMMMVDELGLPPQADRPPLSHGGLIGASYLLGAILPAIPFLFLEVTREAMYVSITVGALELVTVGIIQARYSGTSRLRGAGEILLIGLATALVVFLVTYLGA